MPFVSEKTTYFFKETSNIFEETTDIFEETTDILEKTTDILNGHIREKVPHFLPKNKKEGDAANTSFAASPFGVAFSRNSD